MLLFLTSWFKLIKLIKLLLVILYQSGYILVLRFVTIRITITSGLLKYLLIFEKLLNKNLTCNALPILAKILTLLKSE